MNDGKRSEMQYLADFGFRYASRVERQLRQALEANHVVLKDLCAQIVNRVKQGQWIYGFGSGHSALLPLELFHRAGGVAFFLPVVADYLMPQAGPSVVRVLERTPGSAEPLLSRMSPARGEMIWIISQSGINGACIDMALQARERGLHTVAWTSRVHSGAVPARHPSGKKLFEVCDQVVDLCGEVGDASVPIEKRSDSDAAAAGQGAGPSFGAALSAGPLSSLTAIFLAHSVLTSAAEQLENDGVACVYSSVNTPTGESRNRDLEKRLKARAPWLS